MRLTEVLLFFLLFLAAFPNISALEEDVIELTDKNFEELTQISTGQTTGAWFIKFYAPWCVHCKAISRTWSDLATELKNQINIAKIDATVHQKTRKRFKIEGFPTLLYFRNGKMYDYKAHDRTLEALKQFVLENYKNVTSSDPPEPLSYYDTIKDAVIEIVDNINKIYKHALTSLVVIICASFFLGVISTLIMLKIARCLVNRFDVQKVHNQVQKAE